MGLMHRRWRDLPPPQPCPPTTTRTAATARATARFPARSLARSPARAPEEAGIEASGNRRLPASQELQPDESGFVEVIEVEQEEMVLEGTPVVPQSVVAGRPIEIADEEVVARGHAARAARSVAVVRPRDAAPRLCAHPRPALRSLLSHASLVPHCPRSVGLARGRLTSRGSAHDANVGVCPCVRDLVSQKENGFLSSVLFC